MEERVQERLNSILVKCLTNFSEGQVSLRARRIVQCTRSPFSAKTVRHRRGW